VTLLPAPVPAAIETLALAIETMIDAVAPAVETGIDAVTLAIQTPLDAVTLAVEVRGGLFMTRLGGPFRTPVQLVIDARSPEVEAGVDAITTAIEPVLDAVALSVEPRLYPISRVAGLYGQHGEQAAGGAQQGDETLLVHVGTPLFLRVCIHDNASPVMRLTGYGPLEPGPVHA